MGAEVDPETRRRILRLREKLERAGLGGNAVALISMRLLLDPDVVEAVLKGEKWQ
jgi:hypothetical protein